MGKDYRIHPVFGKLTDPEEIAIFDRQQEREEYERMAEKYYQKEMEKAEERAYYRAMEDEYLNAIWIHYMEEMEYELEAK